MKGDMVNMAVTGIGTYASYTNSYGNTQNAGNKTGSIRMPMNIRTI